MQGKGSRNFSIDSRGFIQTSTPLDYEKTSSYILTVIARDSGSPAQTASAKVNITIVNVDDNVPVFETSSAPTKVREDVAIGTRVVRLNATDADGNDLTFHIIGGNVGGAFAIQNSTGLVTVATKLDRENVAKYHLAVRATDTSGKFVNNNATIEVMDVNDNAPKFISPSYSKDIMENLAPGMKFLIHIISFRERVTFSLGSPGKAKKVWAGYLKKFLIALFLLYLTL